MGKKQFYQNLYSQDVPATYELVNHVLTFGLDVAWRKRAARAASLEGGTRWADMCTGTGEMAVYLRRLAPEGTVVHAIDFSLPMMTKAIEKSEAREIRFIASDVKSLAFSDESFDLVTISFVTRNLNLNRDILVRTFAEFRRVLKPGGLLVNVETSQPSSSLIRLFFRLYVRLFVRLMGTLISGARGGYACLAHTIPRFYSAEELADIMREAGLGDVTFQRRIFGAAAIHQAVRSE